MRTRTGILCAAGLMAGCPSPASIELKEAPDRIGLAWCERVRECSVLGMALLGETTCQLAAFDYRNDTFALLDDWVADGTVSYDAEAMARCLDDIAAAPCVDTAGLLTDVGDCGAAIAGTVTAGGACQGSPQCAPGLFCDLASCPGTCQPRGGTSAACSVDAGCQPGLECRSSACAALPVADQPCDSAFACAPGFACVIPDGEDLGTCRGLSFDARSGEACDPLSGTFCLHGLACAEQDPAGAAWLCVAPSTLGQACNVAVPSACPVGSVCVVATHQVTGICTTLPGEGQACLSGGVILSCREGLACDSGTHLCVRQVDNGQICSVEAQCAVSCDGGVCVDPDCTH